MQFSMRSTKIRQKGIKTFLIDWSSQVGIGVVPNGGRLKRAGNSLYLESAPTQRWPQGQPIYFMFDQSVNCEFHFVVHLKNPFSIKRKLTKVRSGRHWTKSNPRFNAFVSRRLTPNQPVPIFIMWKWPTPFCEFSFTIYCYDDHFLNCSCGLSYVGRIEPANPIYLSFMCGNPMGVAIHETLHALGLQHEQLRIGLNSCIKKNNGIKFR